MTKYLNSTPFSVSSPGSQQYRDNWDACFSPKSDIRKQVEEFHYAFGLPVHNTPVEPTDERVRLRLRLITEEYLELIESCVGEIDRRFHDQLNYICDSYNSTTPPYDGVDLVEFADACADLDYVVEGARLEFGINGKPIAAAIHASNMTKLVDGKPVYRADGKVAKPDTYSPADVRGELLKQGAFL